MSRRLIIIILVVLIIGVLGGTIVLVMQRFRTTVREPLSPSATPSLTTADDGEQQLVNPTGDDDGDGLPNAQEVVWGTDPSNPDTDGDGFLDGEEVANNHNPTQAGPNDELPPAFQPHVNVQPGQPIQVEQYFAGNVNLFPHNGNNLTAEYNRRYPESERTEENAVSFAKELGVVSTLPRVDESKLVLLPNDSSQTVGHYLDAARGYDSLMDSTSVGEVLHNLFTNNDSSAAISMASYVHNYQERILATPVPPSAQNLHKLLLGFTEVLNATYVQLTAYEEDPIKALNSVYQLEVLSDQYMPLIAGEFDRLEHAF